MAPAAEVQVVAPGLPRVCRVDLDGVDVETFRGAVRVHRDGRLEAPLFLDREQIFAALVQELIFGFFGEEVEMAKKPMPAGCKGGACPPKGKGGAGGKKGGKRGC